MQTDRGTKNHPSNTNRWNREEMTVPTTLPLYDGYITCLTCHYRNKPEGADYKRVRMVKVKGDRVDWATFAGIAIPIEPSTAGARLFVQNLAHLPASSSGVNGFSKKGIPSSTTPRRRNGVVGVPRHIQDPEVRRRGRIRSVSSLPLIFGIATSVSSRWISPRWASERSSASRPFPASSTL